MPTIGGASSLPVISPAFPITQSPAPSGTSTANGDTDRSQVTPEGSMPFSWYDTPGASATNDPMNRPGVAAALTVPMLFRGSVVGLSLSATANKTAGVATFQVRKNGSASGMPSLVWSSSTDVAVSRFAKGTYGFVRGDELDVVFTTDASYLPTTAVVEVIVWVTQDPEETI